MESLIRKDEVRLSKTFLQSWSSLIRSIGNARELTLSEGGDPGLCSVEMF